MWCVLLGQHHITISNQKGKEKEHWHNIIVSPDVFLLVVGEKISPKYVQQQFEFFFFVFLFFKEMICCDVSLWRCPMYLSHHHPHQPAKKHNRGDFIMRRRRNRLKTKGKNERVKKMDCSRLTTQNVKKKVEPLCVLHSRNL